MRDIFTVVKFTMKDMVKRKSFIISTLIILTFIVVGFNVPNLIKSFNGDNSGDKLLIIDSKNVFEGTLENLKQMDLGYEFEITNEDLKFEDVKKKIENEEIKEAIIINQENEKIKELDCVSPIKSDLEIKSLGEFIEISGNVKGIVKLECDLCLKEFEYELDFDIDEMFA